MMEFFKNNFGYIIGFFTIPTIKLIVKIQQFKGGDKVKINKK